MVSIDAASAIQQCKRCHWMSAIVASSAVIIIVSCLHLVVCVIVCAMPLSVVVLSWSSRLLLCLFFVVWFSADVEFSLWFVVFVFSWLFGLVSLFESLFACVSVCVLGGSSSLCFAFRHGG